MNDLTVADIKSYMWASAAAEAYDVSGLKLILWNASSGIIELAWRSTSDADTEISKNKTGKSAAVGSARKTASTHYISGSDILHSILNKSINEFERQNSSFYLNEMTTKNDMIVELYFKNLLGIPYFIFSFVSAVVACIYLNWIMLIVMFVFSLLTVFVTNKAGKNIEKTSKVFSDILPEYTQKVKDYFEGIKVIPASDIFFQP